MGLFATPYDIANRACQHLGVPRITNFSDNSKQAVELGFVYDKLRRSELEKSVWMHAVKRAVLRKIVVGTTKTITPAAWAVGTTYGRGDVIKYDNLYWISNVASNVGNTPGVGGLDPSWSVYYGPLVAQLHDVAVAYIPGDLVYASSTAYIAIAANTNQAPPNATYWLPLTATLGTTSFFSPIGYPKSGSPVRQIYRLPANFMRIAPLDPKAAGNVRSNTSAGMAYNDYEFEGDYMLSALQGSVSSGTNADPLVLRFVADASDVPSMPNVFCEALAARMAVETAEIITNSRERKMTAITLYDSAVAVAKMINAIESGTTEPEPNTPTAPQGAQQGNG